MGVGQVAAPAGYQYFANERIQLSLQTGASATPPIPTRLQVLAVLLDGSSQFGNTIAFGSDGAQNGGNPEGKWGVEQLGRRGGGQLGGERRMMMGGLKNVEIGRASCRERV